MNCYYIRAMGKIKALTAVDLARALKDLPTKKDVKEIVDNAIHNQLSEFHAKITMPALEGIEKRLNSRFDRVEAHQEKMDNRLQKLTLAIDKLILNFKKLKDSFDGVQSEFSKTPFLRQFKALKRRVERLEHLPD